ncbi:hypothetical protein MLD38_022422 [Melastoma candidum]|uniref:Uncharacterized protein n=1 Tax=Melastoma candidum TaxID=119954 RepID=A0ACB9QML0_9MYRT|nr:hypothetical protein MLD38_022422 [Melastoma candidum]
MKELVGIWLNLFAINEECPWESLPKRLQVTLSTKDEWHRRIVEHSIKKRLQWRSSFARKVCKESEYYEDLMQYLRRNLALFLYHLAEYVCRVMRISPFRYYCDMIFEVMRNEQPYDNIPNFSAANALRLTGIGRNEFIDIMNRCRSKKIMWKLNKSIAKEMLPIQPVDFPIEPWWGICLVNFTLEEFKRGLVFFDVPAYPDDRFKVARLEGFVSNREQSYEDPIEELLYALFVVSRENATIAELASTLQADIAPLQAPASFAWRLGWDLKIIDPSSVLQDVSVPGTPRSILTEGDYSYAGMESSIFQEPNLRGELQEFANHAFSLRCVLECFQSGGVAMDTHLNEVVIKWVIYLHTSGHISDVPIEETNHENKDESSSVEEKMTMIEGFEPHTAKGSERRRKSYHVDILRCESLASLAPATLDRLFQRDYDIVVSVIPLPFSSVLPGPQGPIHFGPPSYSSLTPWMKLVLYSTAMSGPLSVVLMKGQCLRLLPAPLAGCEKALIWSWDGSTVGGLGGKFEGNLVKGGVLLHCLNSLLKYSALLVQPLSRYDLDESSRVVTLDVPLPSSMVQSLPLVRSLGSQLPKAQS